MEKFKNKKIPTIIIIASLLLIIYSSLTKDYDHFSENVIILNDLYKSNFDIPIEYYYVNFLGLEVNFRTIQFIAIFLIGLGIYWFIYKDDNRIMTVFKSLYTITHNKIKKFTLKPDKKQITKIALIFIVVILAFCAIGLFINFYFSIKDSSEPISISESIFLSIVEVGSKILALLVIIAIIKGLFSKNK